MNLDCGAATPTRAHSTSGSELRTIAPRLRGACAGAASPAGQVGSRHGSRLPAWAAAAALMWAGSIGALHATPGVPADELPPSGQGQVSTATDPPGPATPGQAAPAARSFTAPVGMWFQTVRPDRVADFEQVIAYLQDALARSADPRIRQQAAGWRMYRAAEPGPNGTVLYVFVMDPAVAGADYGLGRVLADVYGDDVARLQEIWKLYTGAVTGGGSLLNLTPVGVDKPGLGGAASPAAPRPAAPSTARPAPPDQPRPADADPGAR